MSLCYFLASRVSSAAGGSDYVSLTLEKTHPLKATAGGVYALQYSPDNRRIVAGYGDSGIEVISLIH